MEVDDKIINSDKIHIQNDQVGTDIVNELKSLRREGAGSVKIVCSDKCIYADIEPLLLSTRLFAKSPDIDAESHIICSESTSEEVQLALGQQ